MEKSDFWRLFMDDVSMTSFVGSGYGGMNWQRVSGLTWTSDGAAMSD